MNMPDSLMCASGFVSFDREEIEGGIVARFRKVVSALGGNLALKSGSEVFTFQELEDRSNALACALGEHLRGSTTPVALMFKHCNNSIIAQLAVLKLGKFYSCLDVELRKERQLSILSQLGARYLLCNATTLETAMNLNSTFPEAVLINIDDLKLDSIEVSPAPVKAKPDDLAYIVNTSGSTGVPKGVMLSHANVLLTAYIHGQDSRINGNDRSLHICPVSAASAGLEIFTALLNGSAVFPFSIKDSGIWSLQGLIVEEQITTFVASPILFRLVFRARDYREQFPSVRLVRLGGDRVTRQDMDIFRKRFDAHCRLRVGYGASEYMPAMQLFINGGDEVSDPAPLGHPMQGCIISLIDENGEPVPRGKPGEIVITSRYMSLGYWNDPERTAKAFHHDPGRYALHTYFTGDVAYQDTDGRFHFVGRRDFIVKINGKQVCTSDVQQALLALPGISDAAVVPINSSQSGTLLVAFIVVPNQLMTISQLRAALAADLPYEAMPTKLVTLNDMPLIANNKIDLEELKRIAEANFAGFSL